MAQREIARARVVSNRFIGSPLKFCSMGRREGNTVLEYYGAKRERGRTAVVSLTLSVANRGQKGILELKMRAAFLPGVRASRRPSLQRRKRRQHGGWRSRGKDTDGRLCYAGLCNVLRVNALTWVGAETRMREQWLTAGR